MRQNLLLLAIISNICSTILLTDHYCHSVSAGSNILTKADDTILLWRHIVGNRKHVTGRYAICWIWIGYAHKFKQWTWLLIVTESFPALHHPPGSGVHLDGVHIFGLELVQASITFGLICRRQAFLQKTYKELHCTQIWYSDFKIFVYYFILLFFCWRKNIPWKY